MKESYIEGVATHDDPESCVHVREGMGEALTGACAVLALYAQSSEDDAIFETAVEDMELQRPVAAVQLQREPDAQPQVVEFDAPVPFNLYNVGTAMLIGTRVSVSRVEGELVLEIGGVLDHEDEAVREFACIYHVNRRPDFALNATPEQACDGLSVGLQLVATEAQPDLENIVPPEPAQDCVYE